MIIACDGCGKKYKVNPDSIRGERARFKCKACERVFTVDNPAPDPGAPAEGSSRIATPVGDPERVKQSKPTVVPSPSSEQESRDETLTKMAQTLAERRAKGLSLRAKMALLFLLVPVSLMVAAGVSYLTQLKSLSALITVESSVVVQELAEKLIEEKSRSVASQVAIYLGAHPEATKESFNAAPDFHDIAVQPVGTTGYTALYELPDAGGVWRTWAHTNPKIIGIDMSSLEKPLGDNFPGFWKIFSGVTGRKESRGYYRWQDADGQVRGKFMVCTPVSGTPFVIAATTYLDEFTSPVQKVESAAGAITERTRAIVFGILGVNLVLTSLVVLIYGYRITKRIKSLTDIAEAISVGEFGAEIDTTSNDELSDLAKAIGRMQESIRVSIERLRRRRSA